MTAILTTDNANEDTPKPAPELHPPLAMIVLHNMAGLPLLVRIDHIVAINGATATADVPVDANDPSKGTKKMTMSCTQLLLLNCNTQAPVVAERIEQVCDIVNEGMKHLQRQVTQQQQIMLPRM